MKKLLHLVGYLHRCTKNDARSHKYQVMSEVVLWSNEGLVSKALPIHSCHRYFVLLLFQALHLDIRFFGRSK